MAAMFLPARPAEKSVAFCAHYFGMMWVLKQKNYKGLPHFLVRQPLYYNNCALVFKALHRCWDSAAAVDELFGAGAQVYIHYRTFAQESAKV